MPHSLLAIYSSQMGDDNESEDNVVISDINDVFESILLFCPRRVCLALNDDHESSELEYCIRPDLCVSKYLKIPFQKLREIAEPHDWGRRFCCSAIFRPNQSQSFHRSDGTRIIWIIVDPSAVNWSPSKFPSWTPSFLHAFSLLSSASTIAHSLCLCNHAAFSPRRHFPPLQQHAPRSVVFIDTRRSRNCDEDQDI